MGIFQNALTGLAGLMQNAAEVIKGTRGEPSPIYGAGGWFVSDRAISQEKLMQEARGFVFACISKIAEEIGSAKLRLYESTGSNRKDWTEIEEHELLDLLNAPSSNMPRFELFQLWSMHDDLTGNAYWHLLGVEKETDKPTGILPINPKYIKAKIMPSTGELLGYEIQKGTSTAILKPWQIIHFRRPNPNNSLSGLGPTEAAADAIDAYNWQSEWNRRFFQNAGRPGLVLETSMTDQKLIALLRESFDDRYSGASKAHKTAILPAGVKIANQGFSQKDMDFSELRRAMRDEILAHYGVPHVVLGLGAGENLNRATAETTDYVFSKRTIRPKLIRFVTYLNEFLVPMFGDNLVLEFDDPVSQNVELAIKEDSSALAGMQYKTVNEVRAEHGLAPLDGDAGNTIYGGSFVTPLGKVPEAKSSPKATRTKKSVTAKPRKSQFKRASEKRSEIAETIAKKLKEAMVARRKDIMSMDWQEVWDAMVKRVAPHEKELQKILAKYADGLNKRMQKALAEEMKSQKAVTAGDLVDEEAEVGIIFDMMTPEFLKILEEEGTSAAALIGEAFDATEERMLASLDKATKLLAQKYTQTTVDLVREQLRAGIDAGEHYNEIAKRIDMVAEYTGTDRAKTTAKTEAFRVANFSTRSAWQQSGVVKSVKWYTANDEKVCPYCGAQDGTVVGIDDNFYDKGDSVDGEDSEGNTVSMTVDYADVENPPLHPDCRCYIRPEEITI